MEDKTLEQKQEELNFQREKRLEERQVQWFNNQGANFASYGVTTNYLNPYDDNLLNIGYSAETIKKALESITKSDTQRSASLKIIREFSRHLFISDDAYGTSIMDIVGSILWVDTLLPQFNIEEVGLEKYLKNKEIVRSYLTSIFDKDTLNYIVQTLLINGLYVGYETGNTGNALMQHLPIDYCKLLGKVNGYYEVAFDFSYFDSQPKHVINYYPLKFKTIYNLYKDGETDSDGNSYRWYTLDWQKTFVFTTPKELPILAKSFKNILLKYQSDTYLEEGLGSEELRFVIQKIPTDKETGNVLADAPVVTKFHNAIVQKMPKNIVVITSPFDTKPESYSENKMSTTSEKRDYINKQVLKSVGLSEASLGVATAQSGYKIFIHALESRLNLILNQIGHRISYQISNIDNKHIHKTLNWKINFLPITTQNREEWFKSMLDLSKEGGSISLPYQIATGLPLEDIKSLLMVEKSEDLYSYLHKEESEDSGYKKKGGREATTDDGESSKDRGLKDEV